MKLFARLVLLATGLLLLAHYLPAGYWLLAGKSQRAPFIFYSCVTNQFLFTRSVAGELQRQDQQGRVYERNEFEALLPLDNYMQLYKDRRMPKEINGVAVTPEKLRRDRVNLRLKPVALDSPAVALYPLIESESGRVKLEMPGDFMRFTTGVEFIDVKSNQLIADKSAKFTAAFTAAGFAFPVQRVGGNPSTLKPYDEGYFLLDAKNELYQLKQVRGEPELKRIIDVVPAEQRPAWAALKPRYLHVQEQDNREVRLLIIDASGQASLVIGADYRLVPLPLKTYDPATMALTVRGDMLNRLVTATGEAGVEAVVLDRDYQPVNRYAETLTPRAATAAGKMAARLFPFTLDFEADDSGFLGFHFTVGSPFAWGINMTLLLALAGWRYFRKQTLRTYFPELAAVALGGLSGLVLVWLLPKSQ